MIKPSNDNERLVEKFFKTLSNGDLEALRGMLHADATWHPQVRDVPGAGIHRGRDTVIDGFLAPVRGLFEPGDPKVYVDSLASSGALVMAETRGIGKLRNGKPYENYYAWAIEIKDGLVFAVREYMDGLYIQSLIAD